MAQSPRWLGSLALALALASACGETIVMYSDGEVVAPPAGPQGAVARAAEGVARANPPELQECIDEGVVEQLLDVLNRAVGQYEALAERFVALKAHTTARAAVLAVPVELSCAVGAICVFVVARLAAAAARREGQAQLQKLQVAMRARTTQWAVAARESTHLAALLQKQQAAPQLQQPQQGHGQAQQQPRKQNSEQLQDQDQVVPTDAAAADASKRSGRDTDPSKVKPTQPSTICDGGGADASPARDGSACRSQAAPRGGHGSVAGTDAEGDAAVSKRLRFDDNLAGEPAVHELHVLVEELNRSRLEQGLEQLRLVPPHGTPATAAEARTPLPCLGSQQHASPLASAAAGAAVFPQPMNSPLSPTAADEVRRLQLRIVQLEEQMRGAAAAADPAGSPAAAAKAHAQPPPPAAAQYVTHKEMELVQAKLELSQENAVLKQQLQQRKQQIALLTAGTGADAWVTTTRGGAAAEGDAAAAHEVWVPASSLSGSWAARTPGPSILAGAVALTPPRLVAGGSARHTPASEGSTKTAHTPGSSGAAARVPSCSGAIGPQAGMPVPPAIGPVHTASANASLGASPSRPGSAVGTPRGPDRLSSGLQDTRHRIEQLGVLIGALKPGSPLSSAKAVCKVNAAAGDSQTSSGSPRV